MKIIKQFSYNLLTENKLGRLLFRKTANSLFPGSAVYWEKRYRKNGTSGAGSYGEKALYKAAFLNRFVADNRIASVVELGCGDGNQASYFRFPFYTGYDVSESAIHTCSERFKGDDTKCFFVYNSKNVTENQVSFQADLALSLDVIFHLVEDGVFEDYMKRLFDSASKYVIIYAWDVDEKRKYHVRHRRFSEWVSKNITNFHLIEKISKVPFCDFFVYQKNEIM